MENTTKMYIEHIVIGMQTTLLIFFILICLDKSTVKGLEIISSVMEIVIVIPIAYSLGIFMDRLCKHMRIFNEKSEEPVKQKACKFVFGLCERESENIKCRECKGCRKDKISIEVWKKFNEMEYYVNAMTRKRILRATSVNFFFLSITLLVFGGLQKINFLNFEAQVFLFLISVLICVGCFKTYQKIVEEYYKKQKKYIRKLLEMQDDR